tara:strand:- start:1458 stop:1877 length:420 start_codon:yes stop_codon:yes gene_type:complete
MPARARNTDPATSHQAAQSDMNELENLVYRVIHLFGAVGCISDDVLNSFNNDFDKNPTGYGSVTPRYKSLIEKKLVVVPKDDNGNDVTRVAKSNKQQRVMIAATHLTPEELEFCKTTKQHRRCECCGQIIKEKKERQNT